MKSDETIRRAGLTLPRIDGEAVNVQGQRQRTVTRWRAASSVGIKAAVPKRPSVQEGLKAYLGEVLEYRFNHDVNFQNVPVKGKMTIWDYLGWSPPNDLPLSDKLIGIGNPLDPFELKKVTNLPSTKKSQ